MSLVGKYEAKLASKDILDDYAQRQCIALMEGLVSALNLDTSTRKSWLFSRRKIPQGFYLFGPVGAGKTFLLDLLYDEMTFPQKKRFHFHHFMQEIDAQLRRLQGHKNPLKVIAKELLASTRLLCLDEFMVEDVANAMILGELLPALLKKGLILVATSNTLPHELYLHGLQRRRFMPAILAIEAHCDLLKLGGQKDYRLGRELEPNSYIFPLGPEAFREMEAQFQAFAGQDPKAQDLSIQKRVLSCLGQAKSIVWFDFKTICNVPRSQLDYLEIAKRYDMVMVSDVPKLEKAHTLAAILLMHFIDVMYDAGVRLIMSAEVSIEALYQEGELAQEFKRTSSRLQEMQSADYLARHVRRL